MSIELAWAAGFFDGEGNINCSIDKNRHLHLSVAQTSIEPLERFKAAVECGNIYGPYPGRGGENSSPQWWFSTGSLGVIQHIVEKLDPYLCSIKRKQISDAFTKYFAWVPIENVNYTIVECEICGLKSRPGPIAHHKKRRHT